MGRGRVTADHEDVLARAVRLERGQELLEHDL
jgi:hypothetical protein